MNRARCAGAYVAWLLSFGFVATAGAIACEATGSGNQATPTHSGSGGSGGSGGALPNGGSGNVLPPPDADVPEDASNCGAQTEPIELITLGDPPDMLVVLDRSGSMILPPGMIPGQPTKWNMMKSSLSAVLEARDGNIRFGLTVFPTDNACSVDPGARVPIAIDNATPIIDYLNGIGPDGNTPAHYALIEALAHYETIPVNPAGQYVLFATDGIPNCGGDPPNVDITADAETVAAVEDLAAAGIHTYVLGFGGMLGLDPQVLNDAAQAGLEPKPGGPPYFYHADDAATLQAALDAIAGGVIVPSCSFQLASPPPLPDDVAVYFDGQAVPRDPGHGNGWDYFPDGSTITFFGSYCDTITAGQVESVEFIYGCPGPIVN